MPKSSGVGVDRLDELERTSPYFKGDPADPSCLKCHFDYTMAFLCLL